MKIRTIAIFTVEQNSARARVGISKFVGGRRVELKMLSKDSAAEETLDGIELSASWDRPLLQ